MPISVECISAEQAEKITATPEGQYSDVKSRDVSPAHLTKLMSALANTDGGDLYIGIDEEFHGQRKFRIWRGFVDEEAANGHLQAFEQFFPLGMDFSYEFLDCPTKPGLVLHAQINRTQAIKRASNGIPYVRRGAQSLPVDSADSLKRLEYAKGITTFEIEPTNAPKEAITTSDVITSFMADVVPTAEPEAWLRKQGLLRSGKPTVAGLLLFADEPQAALPKHCGIKVYRYKTRDAEGFREVLDFTPKTVEGCLYDQIRQAVQLTKEITESIPKMGVSSLESITYPPETLHEIVTNAIIHRDYSIADDVHIRIFDDRIEVQSPGRLPAHVTVKNILDERFARNGAIVRILNKFADPPNKDVGEGLNTAFAAMQNLGLKEPVISERENSVLVVIKHELLASPEEAIMDYLSKHESIKNRQAREVTHIRADYQIKAVFGRMVKNGMIEQVPGTRTSSTAYRRVPDGPTVYKEPEPTQDGLFGVDLNGHG